MQDDAVDYATHPVNHIHPYAVVRDGEQIPEAVFRALVTSRHGLNMDNTKSRAALKYILKLKAHIAFKAKQHVKPPI
jgi:hypothetical protein